jgi:hypothetical protein
MNSISLRPPGWALALRQARWSARSAARLARRWAQALALSLVRWRRAARLKLAIQNRAITLARTIWRPALELALVPWPARWSALTRGPVGTVAGAAIGGALGGVASHGAVRVVNPQAEDDYWRVEYTSAPTYRSEYTYDDYGPAYRYGVASYARYSGGTFEEVDTELAANWEKSRLNSRLSWIEARDSSRAAWNRIGA